MNLPDIFSPTLFTLIGKVGILILIVLYAIFSLIITLQVRGLTRLVRFTETPLSGIILSAFFLHLLLVISLFFTALAIL